MPPVRHQDAPFSTLILGRRLLSFGIEQPRCRATAMPSMESREGADQPVVDALEPAAGYLEGRDEQDP